MGAELFLRCLIVQLTTLRAALHKLNDWIAASAAEQRYRLLVDIGDSVNFCQLLVDSVCDSRMPLSLIPC